MKVIELDQSHEALWEDFVMGHKQSLVFHRAIWRRILSENFNIKPTYLLCIDRDRNVRAVLPLWFVDGFFFGRRMVSLPFHFFSGPLYTDRHALKEILLEAMKRSRNTRARYLELKMRFALDEKTVQDLSLRKRQHFIVSVLKLSPDPNTIWKRLDKGSVRWSVRKAEKNDVKLHFASSEDDLKDFYNLFVKNRKDLGVPPYSNNFFQEVWKYLWPKNMRILLAKRHNIPVATMLIFTHRRSVLYYWSACDRKHLQFQGTSFLIWKAIAWACKNGYERFDFGLTSPAHAGLLSFKNKWNTVDISVPYYYYTVEGDQIAEFDYYTSFSFAKRMWRGLPLMVTRFLGPTLLKQFA